MPIVEVTGHDRLRLLVLGLRSALRLRGLLDGSARGVFTGRILVAQDAQRTDAMQRRDNLLRKELAWLRRGAPARTTKPKFRIDAANALIENSSHANFSRLALTATCTNISNGVALAHSRSSVNGCSLY